MLSRVMYMQKKYHEIQNYLCHIIQGQQTCLARGVQLDNGVTSPCDVVPILVKYISFQVLCLYDWFTCQDVFVWIAFLDGSFEVSDSQWTVYEFFIFYLGVVKVVSVCIKILTLKQCMYQCMYQLFNTNIQSHVTLMDS